MPEHPQERMMLYEPSDAAYSTAADFGNVEASGAACNKEFIGAAVFLCHAAAIILPAGVELQTVWQLLLYLISGLHLCQ